MKTPLTKTVLLAALISVSLNGYGQLQTPQKITIAGKIDNYDPKDVMTLYLERVGFSAREQILPKTDSLGNFTATFESYAPLSAYFATKRLFLGLYLRPGDSLFLQFDGVSNDPRSEILYSGNAAKRHADFGKFEQKFSENYNLTGVMRALTSYDTDRSLRYLDTLQQRGQIIYNQFVAEHNPDEDSKNLAQLYIRGDYYSKLEVLADESYDKTNKMVFWERLENFYADGFFSRLSVDTSMLISSSHLHSLFQLTERHIRNMLQEKLKIDRITIDYRIPAIIESVSDPLLRQVLLMRCLAAGLEYSSDIATYERFQDVVETHITEPFLREPLHQKYLEIKTREEQPQIYTENVLKTATNLSVNQVIDSIFQQNKGKIVYIDFWGTWCAPCIAEMPQSKKMKEELKNKDVVFVYVALESERPRWQAIIDQHELGDGEHYLLSRPQSRDMRNVFGIDGVPFYVLIDQNGIIREQGNHLRPSNPEVLTKIREWLK